MPRVFTNLDLHWSTPARAQPRIGEWGPVGVPSTRSKAWWRLWISLAFVLAATAVIWFGHHVFTQLR